MGSFAPQKVLLIRRFLIAVSRRNHHAFDAKLRHLVEEEASSLWIRSLEQRSGQSFGYRYYEQPEKRQPAVDRWHAWLKDQDAPQIARPTNEASTD